MGCAAEFCKRHELRMCSTSSWRSYTPMLLQNQLVKYLTDHFGKPEPKKLTIQPQRKSVTEPEIECQSLLLHSFLNLLSKSFAYQITIHFQFTFKYILDFH